MKADCRIEEIFKDAPESEKEEFLSFNRDNPYKSILVDGKPMEYATCGGGGKTVIILPGLLGDGKSLYRQILALKDQHKVIAVSYLDSGRIDDQMKGLIKLMEAEGVSRATFLGQTLGGYLAQCFLRAHPEKVEELILAHAGLPKKERVPAERKIISGIRMAPFSLSKYVLKKNLFKVLASVPQASARDAARAKQTAAYFNYRFACLLTKERVLARYGLMLDLDQNHSFSPGDFKDWQGGVLVITGRRDPFSGGQLQQLEQLYKRLQIQSIDEGGQLTLFLRPEEVNAVILKFLMPVENQN